MWRALKRKPILGDKAYDSAYIKVKETWRRGVRSEVRLKCKELLESEGIYRFKSIFGEIKRDVGSYERTRSFHIAQLFILAKFILFNMEVLFFIWMIFQTLSSNS